MNQIEFNKRRQKGWNPKSPENIPIFQHGEEPTEFSKEIVIGYFWSEKKFDDIQEIGQTLDSPEDMNLFGYHGSRPTEEYGEGYIYTHRDSTEAVMLWQYMERGKMYIIEGYAFDRLNSGLVSGGSLDQIERIFPLENITSWMEVTLEELENFPTLYDRYNSTN